jgi:hypothetical protein
LPRTNRCAAAMRNQYPALKKLFHHKHWLESWIAGLVSKPFRTKSRKEKSFTAILRSHLGRPVHSLLLHCLNYHDRLSVHKIDHKINSFLSGI